MRLIQIIGLLVLISALTLLLACGAEVETETKTETDTEMAAEMEGDAEMVTETVAWNKVCPVEGGDIDPAVETVNYDGKQYGFCCSGCDGKFQAEPAKYAKNLSEDGSEFVEM